MQPSPRLVRFWFLLTFAAVPVAHAQVFVFPREPGKAQVRNFDFAWSHVDLTFPVGVGAGDGGDPSLPMQAEVVAPADGGTATAPSPQDPGAASAGTVAMGAPDGGVDGGTAATAPGSGTAVAATTPDGGVPGAPRRQSYLRQVPTGTGQVRLFFYERERAIAQRAATLIQRSYEKLVERFRYVPAQTFPYILYSSYQEFLQTNLSPVQEGTLGFTSPQDLKLSLPYFGDDRLFAMVSTHELAHQFTIQKVRTVTGASGIMGDPLSRMPLWFIEGLAEYAAHGGIDPETEMLIRDLVINQDPMRGYILGDFFQQGPASFVWIYKMGQARCAFLDETYGEGFVQRVLDETWRLVGRGPLSGQDFVALMERLTGDKGPVISARFERWLKKRAYANYLEAEQDVPDMVPLQGVPEYTDALSASPDGKLLMLRSIEPLTAQSSLVLINPDAPGEQFGVVGDGVPGVESLHLVFGRNFDLGNGRLTFVAERSARDILYVQEVKHGSRDVPAADGGMPVKDVDVSLGMRREFPLAEQGILAAFSPSLSPDEKRVAFIGLLEDGRRDLFLLDVDSGKTRRLTNNPYTERQVHWGKSGILFTSDATEHRRFNLFRVQPDLGDPPERMTVDPRDEQDPQELADGRVFLTAYTEDGRADLYEVADKKLLRRTDIATGLFDASPAADGSMWALLHRNGRRVPVRIAPEQLAERNSMAMLEGGEPPVMASTPLGQATPYAPFGLENIELGPLFGYGGVAQGGIFGQLMGSATDKLKTHSLLLQVAAYGSWELTDGLLFYLNQAGRISWGGGLFQSLRYRTDRSLPLLPFTNYERFYGVAGLARYPFNTFAYLEGEVSVGGASYFVTDFWREVLANPWFRRELLLPEDADAIGDGEFYSGWKRDIGGARPQGEVALRLGFDTLRYDYFAGPIDGSAILLEGIMDWQPTTQEVFGNVRLDAQRYFPLIGRIHMLMRLGAGGTFGGRLSRDYFLSSYDTIRGINFGDERFLVGRHFAYSTAEVQVPLNQLIAIAFLSNLEGIVGVDAGGVGGSVRDMWNHRVLNFVAGVNLGLGPLLLRLHFARPFNILAKEGLPVAEEGQWVTNFSIGMMGFGGFYGQESAQPKQVRAKPGGWGF